MDITAVIPVRAGSTRIKDKNIKPFAGSSLLEIKIEQLKRIPTVNEIIVSSDSRHMLNIAQEHGVKALERPYEYCDEKTKTFGETVQYIAKNNIKSKVMLWVPCVCPCLADETISKGISIFESIIRDGLPYDSIASAVLIKEYLFDEKNPINFTIKNHVPSQQLPNWHYIVNGFFIANTIDMYNWKFVYGSVPFLYELNKIESIDIDDQVDFEYAEYIYKKIYIYKK